MKKKVIVVDDSVSMLSFIKIILIEELLIPEESVIVCLDGLAAWETITRNSDNIALVITDFEMPGIDGVELTSKIKQNYPQIAVLLNSGADKVPKHNADVFLKKPWDVENLMNFAAKKLQPLQYV